MKTLAVLLICGLLLSGTFAQMGGMGGMGKSGFLPAARSHRIPFDLTDSVTRSVSSWLGCWCISQSVLVAEVLLYVDRNRRFIRDGSPGRPPRLSHSS